MYLGRRQEHISFRFLSYICYTERWRVEGGSSTCLYTGIMASCKIIACQGTQELKREEIYRIYSTIEYTPEWILFK